MAGLLINTRGTVLLIDPLLVVLKAADGTAVSETGHRFRVPLPIEAASVPRVDAVLYTHEDGDHFARPAASVLNRNCRPRFVAPRPVAEARPSRRLFQAHTPLPTAMPKVAPATTSEAQWRSW